VNTIYTEKAGNLRLSLALAFFFLVAAIIACRQNAGTTDVPISSDSPSTSAAAAGSPVTLRLGYFPNVTHAQPIIGLARGYFQEALGPNVKLETKTFSAGPSVIEAIFAKELDASYIGPNPTINGYIRSNGEALRIVAGATSGGALFVVRPESGIATPADLAGKRLATPQLGNTQDVALRAYLAEHGLKTRDQGGDVEVIPTSNATILTLFLKGDIDGAWVPEPWGTRLVREAGATVFLDERDLWPDGDFVTTHLIVRKAFLDKHPDVVARLVLAHVEATDWINENRDAATDLVVKGITDATNAPIARELVVESWKNLRITTDPVASSLHKSAEDAYDLGFLGSERPNLDGIYDLAALQAALQTVRP